MILRDDILIPVIRMCRERVMSTTPHELAPLTHEVLELAVVELADRYDFESDQPTRPDIPRTMRPPANEPPNDS